MTKVSKRKPTKPRTKVVKKRTPLDKFYTAAVAYIESIGGSAIVIGGTEIMQYPSDFKFNYRLCVRITGRKPVPKSEAIAPTKGKRK